MAQGGLYRIVYLSRAATGISDLEATCIAQSSYARNAAAGVTGLLLFDGDRFIQALEGAERDVAATMDRIVTDDRHGSIVYLNEGMAEQRQFGDWGMRYKRAPQGCCSNEFLDRVKEDTSLVEDVDLRAAFIGFAFLSNHRPRGYVCSTL